MKLNKILILFVVLLLCTTVVSAGFWDSITGKFNLRVALGLDKAEDQANLQQATNNNMNQLDKQTDNELTVHTSGRTDESERVFSVLYKSQQPPRKVTYYMDFSGSTDYFMDLNANLGVLRIRSAAVTDNSFEMEMKGSAGRIISRWGIENDELKALGQILATEEVDELEVFDGDALIGDGNDDMDIVLSSGIKVKNPRTFSSSDRVKIMSVPANGDAASGQYTLDFQLDCDLSDAEGFEDYSEVPCIQLSTAKQDGFLLGNIQAKEVYIVIKEGASEEPVENFPTCDNGLDDDSDGFVDTADATCSSCTDLDGGINSDVDSMAQVVIPDMPIIAYTDSCYEGILKEAVCFEDGSHFVDVICPEGKVCFNGACIAGRDNTAYVGFSEWQAMNGNLNQLMQRRATALATVKKFANAAGIAIPQLNSDIAISQLARKAVPQVLETARKAVPEVARKAVLQADAKKLTAGTQEKLGLFAKLFGKK